MIIRLSDISMIKMSVNPPKSVVDADYSQGDGIGTCLRYEYCLTTYSNKTAKLLKVLKPEDFATQAEIKASRFFRMMFK